MQLPRVKASAAALLLISLGASGCAAAMARDEARAQARSRGKYRVTLASERERERVAGTCKFVRTIQADADTHPPSSAELPDYFRVEAVVLGADTVVMDGRTGEAYICGPGPLNPDGSPQVPPAATPVPK